MYKYSARFDGLQPGTSYDIHIATELDGKTVVQTKHTIKTLQGEDSDKKSLDGQTQRSCLFFAFLFKLNEL